MSDEIVIRPPARTHLGTHPDRIALDRVRLDAEGMTTPALKKRCANSAAKAGKFLTSAYAIIEADLPYFIELRQRLNAQGISGEGWQQWIKKHFTCDVRTVNRALSSLRGPADTERKKKASPRDKLSQGALPQTKVTNGLVLNVKHLGCNVAHVERVEVIKVLSHGIRMRPVEGKVDNGIWELTLMVRPWQEGMEPFSEPKPPKGSSA